MEYNFDKVINRKNTNSKKYDGAKRRGFSEDLLPMWIADMDFCSPFEVVEAVKEKACSGVFGYSEPSDDYFEALISWYKKSFSVDLNREWIVNTAGIVFAISTAITAFSAIGDSVMVQCPVYYPFLQVIKNNNRRLINNPLVFSMASNQYEINFADFEKKIIDNDVKIFVLCSPHNPVGRVWTTDELKMIGDICLKHNVFVISDEIHANIVYTGNHHSVFFDVNRAYLQNCMVCFSASKTFNLGGLQFSDIIIPNDDLRAKFLLESNKCGCNHPNIFGIVASHAAYLHGEDWCKGLIEYLEGNVQLLTEFLDSNLPKIKFAVPQGTFLAWLDFREYGFTHDELVRKLVSKAKLWLDDGKTFGLEGENFMRLNFACPRTILQKALNQLKLVFEE